MGRFILNKIMSDEGREEMIESIHKRLLNLGNEARSGQIPIEKFVINKNLTKNVDEYSDAKVQPHVQVALKMRAKGVNVNVGDIIPYVICVSDQMGGNIATRAHHPDEVKKTSLTIDYEWYLIQQIHPPISRLCQHIEGTDSGRIADCLGLDSSKFTSKFDEVGKSFTKQSDEEKYSGVNKWTPFCPSCEAESSFECIRKKEEGHFSSGFICPICEAAMSVPSLAIQLMNEIRKEIESFYDSVLKCDEKTCSSTTKRMSVYEHRCINLGCSGSMHLDYSNKQMFYQLDYYGFLFDLEKQKKKYGSDENAIALLDIYKNDLAMLSGVAKKTLNQCSYPIVDLKSIFCP